MSYYKQVIKLGGSSQTQKGYNNLINSIKCEGKNIIVVSAMKGITNSLINLSKMIKEGKENIKDYLDKKIIWITNSLVSDLNLESNSFLEEEYNFLYLKIKKPNLDLQDEINIISIGETLTAKILNQYLKINNFDSIYIDAKSIIYSEQENISLFNSSKFLINSDIIFDNFNKKNTIVVPGFRGRDVNNNISLMSRGGSDTTGSLISSNINANKYQIWTDVNGLYSTDPNLIDNAIIIKSISYDAAQEVSAMGAEILHPYCIRPCREKNIPIEIKNTYNLNQEFTTIEESSNIPDNTIYCITNQENVTVFKIESLNMWNNYGFVYDIFSKFKHYNVDVNIINTSQFDITTTTNDTDMNKLNLLKNELEKQYNVNIVYNCDLVSIVGENIKKYKNLNMIMNTVIKFDIKLTSYSSNDMTLSFVINNKDSKNLVKSLHNVIFPYYSFSCEEEAWWKKFLEFKGPDSCKYLYNLDIIEEKINNLKNMESIDNIYYALKANNNSDIIKFIYKMGLGFETVTLDEIFHIKKSLGEDKKNLKILYTPNFSKIEDYKFVFDNFDKNVKIIVDNISIILYFPEVFKNKEIGLRLDLDYGYGHHNKVITQGQDSKFGMTPEDVIDNLNLFQDYNIKIVGFHSHMGSGINDFNHWINNLNLIIKVYNLIPSSQNKIEWMDIGGGFGINGIIDFDELDKQITNIKKSIDKEIKIFIEPGRYIVAESGIIWGKVTQTKFKNNTKFIGTNIGMTDLIRPALYSAIHPIFFKEKEENEIATIVGPICESGDVLVKNLKVPKNIKPNDSVVILNTGAYGIVMASSYNNRNLPEQEII